jgi:hypothetical protein
MDIDAIELARELLRKLEEKKGCPVHLKIETPESIGGDTITDEDGEFLGELYSRSLEVKRIKGLDPKYEHDIKMLMGNSEGRYNNFGELKAWIRFHNPLYDHGGGDDLYDKAYTVLHKSVLEGRLTRHWPGGNPLPSERCKDGILGILHTNFREEDLEKVNKILDKAGMVNHFHYNIMPTFEGVYVCSAGVDSMEYDSLQEKIADIILKPI